MEVLRNTSRITLDEYQNQLNDRNRVIHILREVNALGLKSFSNNFIRVWFVRRKLKPQQLQVFDSFHQIWSSVLKSYEFGNSFVSSTCGLIEAPPGTGKTYVIAALAITSFCESIFLAYSCNLKDMMSDIDGMNSMTYNSFVMKFMKYEGSRVSFFSSSTLWTTSKMSIELQLWKMIQSAKHSNDCDMDILYCDEIYMIPVFELIWLWMYCKVFKKQLVFTGDRKQQSCMRHVAGYPKNNYPILQLIANVFALETVIRQEGDAEFSHKLNQFREMMHLEDFTETDVAMRFSHLYALYHLFRKHFYEAADYSALYMATHHKTIKKRIEDWIAHHQTLNTEMVNFYFEIERTPDPWLYEYQSKKFVPFLPCIIGQKYIHVDVKTRIKKYVTLLQVQRKALVVKDEEGRIFKVVQVPINNAFIHQEQINELLDAVSLPYVRLTPSNIKMFPLKPLVATYYSVQGMTIAVDKLDLSLDHASCNAIYTGLTRLMSQQQIGRLETKKLNSLEFTHFMNDEFYYKVPESLTATNEDIVHAIFTRVTSINAFESSTGFVKILRNSYWPFETKQEDKSRLENLIVVLREYWDKIVTIASFDEFTDTLNNHVQTNANTLQV